MGRILASACDIIRMTLNLERWLMLKTKGRYVDSNGEQTVSLGLCADGLLIELAGGPPELTPYSDVFAGQIGQGEAECIGLPARPDLRIFVNKRFLRATQAAMRGEAVWAQKRRCWWPLF